MKRRRYLGVSDPGTALPFATILSAGVDCERPRSQSRIAVNPDPVGSTGWDRPFVESTDFRVRQVRCEESPLWSADRDDAGAN